MAATGPLTADSGVINSTGTASYRNAETLGSVLHRNPVFVQVNRSRKSGGGGTCRGWQPRHPNTVVIGLLNKKVSSHAGSFHRFLLLNLRAENIMVTIKTQIGDKEKWNRKG